MDSWKILASLGNIMFRIHTSLGTWTRHAGQMQQLVGKDIAEHPLPVSPDPVAVPSRNYHQLVCDEETNDNAQVRDSNSGSEQTPDSNAQALASAPPVLLPPKDLPIIKRDHPPVLTPHNPETIQSTPRRSSRIKSKLQQLQL